MTSVIRCSLTTLVILLLPSLAVGCGDDGGGSQLDAAVDASTQDVIDLPACERDEDCGSNATCDETGRCACEHGFVGPQCVPLTIATVGTSNRAGCALTETRTIECWGSGASGQLGDGMSSSSRVALTPVAIAVPGPWTALATQGWESCAIDDAERLWCWGNNVNAPAELAPGTSWRSVHVSPFLGCGIQTDGSLWCWGQTAYFDASLPEARVDTPVKVGTDNDWSAVTVGTRRMCALRADGSLWCAGVDVLGTLEVDPEGLKQVQAGRAWTAVTTGRNHACAIDVDGDLYCWGRDQFGVLGIGDASVPGAEVREHALVSDSGDWVVVEAGDLTTCALRRDGTVWCWGVQLYPHLELVERHVPTRIALPDVVTGIDVSDAGRACVRYADGSFACFGSDVDGALCRGSQADKPTAVSIDGSWSTSPTNEFRLSCAIDASGELVCAGALSAVVGAERAFGQTWTSRPGRAAAPWIDVSGGESALCAVRDNGERWCWGRDGAIGSGGDSAHEFGQVDAFADWTAVDLNLFGTGGEGGCGIRAPGSLWCWGANSDGQLGLGDSSARDAPVQVGDATDWTAIKLGAGSACGIRGGDLWCWGADAIGLQSPLRSQVPVQVEGTGWSHVAVGGGAACGIRDGELWCWGSALSGRPTLPVLAASGTWTAIDVQASSSTNHICGVQDGQWVCWGAGSAPAWGPAVAPTPMSTGADWVEVSIGEDVYCARRQGGAVECGGANAFGQLGTGDSWFALPWSD